MTDKPEQPPAPPEQRFPVSIEEEIRRSYLDYAMSVIVGRALPDVRDGLKPVHRRVLYGMWEQGNRHNRAYKKSARIVGDVMGKYHPHGDASIYDTAVRMAQDFSMSEPLVDGQGNFGSVDGDSAAAMRYTEIRLTALAEELVGDDIDKETVDWTLELRRLAPGADRPAGEVPEPPRERRRGNRRRDGDEDPPAQPPRGVRRGDPPPRQPRGGARRAPPRPPRARLPDGRHPPRPPRRRRGLPERPRDHPGPRAGRRSRPRRGRTASRSSSPSSPSRSTRRGSSSRSPTS